MSELAASALRNSSGDADALHRTAIRHAMAQQFDQAIGCFRTLLAIRADAGAHHDLALALHQSGRPDEAIGHYRAALAIEPRHVPAHLNLGQALKVLGHDAVALESYRRATEADPTSLDAYTLLANAQQETGRITEAMASYRRILELRPDHPEAHSNLALALLDQGQLRAAMSHAEQAVALRPQDATLHKNLAVILLKNGEFERGWAEYESRFATDIVLDVPAGLDRWSGDPREGRKLLLIAEQGRGDAIQFVRFGASLNALGIRPTLQCDPCLARILHSTGYFDAVVAPGRAFSQEHKWFPLMSLPRVLAIPEARAYLKADADTVTPWRRRLPQTATFRVGIAWQGNPVAERKSLPGRSFPLAHFSALCDLPLELVSLQLGTGSEQNIPHLIRFDDELDRGPDAFLDTAALMMSLDLVITSDTAIAHLAGALGQPTWLLLHTGSDWRWLQGRDDSPWYPSLRLFRQPRPGDWDAVFAQVRVALQERLGRMTAIPQRVLKASGCA